MNPKTFLAGIFQFGLAGAVLLLSHYDYTFLAVIIVLLPSVYTWLRAGRGLQTLLLASPDAIIGLSVVVLVGLSRPPLGQPVFPVGTQVVITIAYGLWLVWLRQLRLHERSSLPVLAVQQIAAVSAIFLAAAFWHWPEPVVVALVWGSVAVTSLWYLRAVGERAAAIMSCAWALVAAEIAWILYAWQVNYIIKDGYVIVPQAALVILGVGYCFANIYQSHTQKRLSRRRLIEYVAVAGMLLTIVIAGTRWNGGA